MGKESPAEGKMGNAQASSEVQDDISEILSKLEGISPETKAKEPELIKPMGGETPPAVGKEPVATTVKPEEKEGAPETLEGAPEGEGEAPPVSKPEEKDELIKSLREEVIRISRLISGAGPDTVGLEPEPRPRDAYSLPPGPTAEPFVKSEDDLRAVLEDPNKLNSLLGKVQMESFQQLLRVLPRAIDNIVALRLEEERSVSSFFNDNPDLRSCEDYTRKVARDIWNARSREFKGDEKAFYKEVAKEVRSRLGLPQSASGRKIPVGPEVTGKETLGGPVGTPASAPGTGARIPKVTKKESPIQEDIGKMLKIAERR